MCYMMVVGPKLVFRAAIGIDRVSGTLEGVGCGWEVVGTVGTLGS